jgi:hypothetical protein
MILVRLSVGVEDADDLDDLKTSTSINSYLFLRVISKKAQF